MNELNDRTECEKEMSQVPLCDVVGCLTMCYKQYIDT